MSPLKKKSTYIMTLRWLYRLLPLLWPLVVDGVTTIAAAGEEAQGVDFASRSTPTPDSCLWSFIARAGDYPLVEPEGEEEMSVNEVGVVFLGTGDDLHVGRKKYRNTNDDMSENFS